MAAMSTKPTVCFIWTTSTVLGLFFLKMPPSLVSSWSHLLAFCFCLLLFCFSLCIPLFFLCVFFLRPPAVPCLSRCPDRSTSEEREDEGTHQFCCSASGCSSPSSRWAEVRLTLQQHTALPIKAAVADLRIHRTPKWHFGCVLKGEN